MTTPQSEAGLRSDLSRYVTWLLEDQCKLLLHMSDEDIATVLDVTRPTVYAIRKNPSQARVEQIERLERHLESVKAAILTTEANAS